MQVHTNPETQKSVLGQNPLLMAGAIVEAVRKFQVSEEQKNDPVAMEIICLKKLICTVANNAIKNKDRGITSADSTYLYFDTQCFFARHCIIRMCMAQTAQHAEYENCENSATARYST